MKVLRVWLDGQSSGSTKVGEIVFNDELFSFLLTAL